MWQQTVLMWQQEVFKKLFVMSKFHTVNSFFTAHDALDVKESKGFVATKVPGTIWLDNPAIETFIFF